MEKRRIEKVGSIYIDVPEGKSVKRNGAKYIRELVEWMNSRPEVMNENKSHLDLIVEYNLERRKTK